MSELKSSDFFIGLSVKVILVRFAAEELERIIPTGDFDKINKLVTSLGQVLVQ